MVVAMRPAPMNPTFMTVAPRSNDEAAPASGARAPQSRSLRAGACPRGRPGPRAEDRCDEGGHDINRAGAPGVPPDLLAVCTARFRLTCDDRDYKWDSGRFARSAAGAERRHIAVAEDAGACPRASRMSSSAWMQSLRSAAPPRQTRTASGGLPSMQNASLATAATPRARMADENSMRFQGAGSVSQRWKASGFVLTRPLGSSPAASFCRSTLSRRVATSMASAVPLRIQRVARALLSGEAMMALERRAEDTTPARRASGAAR